MKADLSAPACYVALVRGINVGGHKMLAMSDVREMLEELGFADVRSLLQSGNLIFAGPGSVAATLEATLEATAEKRFGFLRHILVRTAREWAAIIERNPFPGEAARDPGHLLVMCLKTKPAGSAAKALEKAIAGREVIRLVGRDLYIVYPDGVGRSKLTNAVIERTLDTRGTARNWNTVLKIRALMNSSDLG